MGLIALGMPPQMSAAMRAVTPHVNTALAAAQMTEEATGPENPAPWMGRSIFESVAHVHLTRDRWFAQHRDYRVDIDGNSTGLLPRVA